MLMEIRSTCAGMECWDTDNKRTVLLPFDSTMVEPKLPRRDLEYETVGGLRAIAESMNIEVPTKIKKADLIALINDHV